jgi:hypothetical protein
MSLLTGIYSSHPVSVEDYHSVLADFSLHGERKTQTIVRGHLIVSSYLHGYQSSNVWEDDSHFLVYSGRIFDIEKEGYHWKPIGDGNTSLPSPAAYLAGHYKKLGKCFLEGINGNFSVVVYEKKTNELIIANDRLGIYPLFVYITRNLIIFSNEYQPILSYHKCNKTLDPTAVAEYFILGGPLDNKTFIREISILPPASLLTAIPEKSRFFSITGTHLKISKRAYFTHNYPLNTRDTPDQMSRDLAELIRNAAQRRAADPANIEADLTGGKDSRLFMGLIGKDKRDQVQFQTFPSEWMNDEENQDVIIVKRLVEKYQLRHVFLPLSADDWIYEPDRFMQQWYDFRRPRLGEKRRMTGYNASVLSGLYYYRLRKFSDPPSRQKIRRILNGVFVRDFIRKANNPFNTLRSAYKDTHVENAAGWMIFNQGFRTFFSTYNRGTLSETNDLYSQATRFDSLFFDQDLLEYLLSVKKEYIQDYYLYKKVYWEHFPHLLEINTSIKGFNRDESLGNPFPLILSDKISRFKEVYNTFLNTDQTWDRGILNRNYFASLNDLENNPHFYCFIDFELWCRRYLT